MRRREVLGRGLEALIPKKEERESLVFVAVERLKPSPFQPRQEIDAQELEGLKDSIKEKGLLQPIVVRKRGEEFEIVAGHRRYLAAKSLGINELPAIIRELTDREVLVFALVENLQRKDLNPMEEAESFKRLHQEFNLNYEEIAQLINKDKTFVANTLRLLKLPSEIQEGLRKGIISRTQARTILSVKDEEKQKTLFYKIIKEKLSVREIEKRVRKRKEKRSPFVVDLEEKLARSLGTKVKILHKKSNRGKILIEYYNLDDLERITKKLI
ncbi:MAG: hypothetical protein B6D56_03375 [Candidatus Omnitrophica bacterium 4484_70.1]|nr:MAG: hypothetical protein B6D56_03375 [Candidatus Omnitrophica bacterium 4484_70.1]